MLQFSIRNSSLISKVESRKLTGALDSCFVLFGTLQQCAPTESGGNRTRDLTVRKPVSNRCARSARFRLESSTSQINDEFLIENPVNHFISWPHDDNEKGDWYNRRKNTRYSSSSSSAELTLYVVWQSCLTTNIRY